MGWCYISCWLSMSIFLLFCSGIASAISDSDSLNFSLEPLCKDAQSTSESPWWVPLQKADIKTRDPCQLHEALEFENISIICCLGIQIEQIGVENCGPCTLETYNLAAACMACHNDDITEGTRAPNINSDSFYTIDSQDIDIPFPGKSSFNQGQRQIDKLIEQFQLPNWLNTPLRGDFFDVKEATILAATPSLFPSLDPSSPVATDFSSLPSATPTTTPTTTYQPGSTGQSSRVPIIAGTVVGAFVGVMLLILIATLYRRRRRRLARIAPPPSPAVTLTRFVSMGNAMKASDEESQSSQSSQSPRSLPPSYSSLGEVSRNWERPAEW